MESLFYQFWLKVADADVYQFLKYFTFLSIEQIQRIEETDRNSNAKPEAQRILAEEMTRLIHGENALAAAQRISQSLFAEDQSDLTEDDFAQLALDGLPSFNVSGSLNIVQALTASGFISQGAVSVNGQKIEQAEMVLDENHQRFQRYAILRRGKRNHALLVWN